MLHKHKCDSCSTIWEHVQRDDVSNEEYNRLHNCPKCGINQRYVLLSSKEERDAWREHQRKRDPTMALILDLLDSIRSRDIDDL